MNSFENIIVSSIDTPVIVHSKKGEHLEMYNRPSFGLSFCISGQITYTMNGKSYISTKSSAVILPKGASYTLSRDKDGLFPLINFDCENYDCREITVIPLNHPATCLNDFDMLQKAFFQQTSRLKILSHFYDLLSSITEGTAQDSPILNPSISYIEENLANINLTNKVIADHLNISEVYLRKLFSKHFHTTPRQYLLDRRIQKAMYLLVNTSHTVVTISQECGFSNPYHFCRAFKQRTGLTPTQYADTKRVSKI